MFSQLSFWQFLFSLLAIVGLWSLSLLLAGLGLAGQVNGSIYGNQDISLFLMSAGTGISGLLLIPSAVFSLLRLIGKPVPRFSFPGRRFLRPALLIVLLPVVLLLGYEVVEKTSLAWVFLPPLHILAVGLPVAWVLYLAVRGLPLGSAQRAWGVWASGLVLGPGISIFLEGVALLVVAVLGISWISTQPELAAELSRVAQRVQGSGGSPDVIVQLIAPYLARPAVLLGALTFLSVIAPLIEELIKPVGVWLLAGFRLTPAAGFAAGALSGAGFALFESLAMTVNADDWAVSVLARSSTAIVHIVLTACSGWALASAWRDGKTLRLAAVYVAVAAFHALWNGLTLLSTVASIPGANFEDSPYPWLARLGGDYVTYILVGGLGLLALIFLLWMNWRLRSQLKTVETML